MKHTKLNEEYMEFFAQAIEIAGKNALPLTRQNLMSWLRDDKFETHWTTIFDGVTDIAEDLLLVELSKLGWTRAVLDEMEERKQDE